MFEPCQFTIRFWIFIWLILKLSNHFPFFFFVFTDFLLQQWLAKNCCPLPSKKTSTALALDVLACTSVSGTETQIPCQGYIFSRTYPWVSHTGLWALRGSSQPGQQPGQQLWNSGLWSKGFYLERSRNTDLGSSCNKAPSLCIPRCLFRLPEILPHTCPLAREK